MWWNWYDHSIIFLTVHDVVNIIADDIIGDVIHDRWLLLRDNHISRNWCVVGGCFWLLGSLCPKELANSWALFFKPGKEKTPGCVLKNCGVFPSDAWFLDRFWCPLWFGAQLNQQSSLTMKSDSRGTASNDKIIPSLWCGWTFHCTSWGFACLSLFLVQLHVIETSSWIHEKNILDSSRDLVHWLREVFVTSIWPKSAISWEFLSKEKESSNMQNELSTQFSKWTILCQLLNPAKGAKPFLDSPNCAWTSSIWFHWEGGNICFHS